MRLWSLHPEYLDAKGLVALWREGLLAQKVLLGETRGYKNHPQLQRFKDAGNTLGAMASFLRAVAEEAGKRGYNFDKSKIINKRTKLKIFVNDGQVEYEFNHLLIKLKLRDLDLYNNLVNIKTIKLHPLFEQKNGGVEDWEIV